MSSDLVQIDWDGSLCTITLNRPDKANALTSAMLHQLADAVADAQNAKAIILTAHGKVFSAGADLADVGSGLATDPAWERLSGTIAGTPGLTIAALNGTVAGGAFGMVLACDLRIAVPTARFFYPVVAMGVAPQPSDPGRMVALIGPARTKMILLAGQKIAAETSMAWGLIEEIVAPEDLTDRARVLAAGAVGAEPTHLQRIKNAVSLGSASAT